MSRLLLPLTAGMLLVVPPGNVPCGSGSPGAGTASPTIPGDTVLSVRPGDEFVSETSRGTLLVRAGGDEIRLSGDVDEMPRMVREGSTVRLLPPRGDGEVDALVELPPWMPVAIRSRALDVSVTDREAPVRIEILSGDLRLEDVSGVVQARTLDGEVEVRGTAGSLGVFTADGDVRVVGHRGDLRIESTDGDLTLREVEGRTVEGSTLDGDVEFEGTVAEGGSLDLSTHDGDVSVGLPASIGADVEVSTFHGAFSSDFRVRTRGVRAGEPLEFEIGGGGARISLRSFDGDVRLHSR